MYHRYSLKALKTSCHGSNRVIHRAIGDIPGLVKAVDILRPEEYGVAVARNLQNAEESNRIVQRYIAGGSGMSLYEMYAACHAVYTNNPAPAIIVSG